MSGNPLQELFNKGGYTFEEGIAVLSRMSRNRRIVDFITRRHRMDYLNQELYKLAKAKHVKMPQQRTSVKKSAGNATRREETHAKKTEQISTEIVTASKKEDDKDVVDFLSLKHHENTRLEDMPNDICRKLWNENRERNLEIKEQHLRMRKAKTNEERASSRAEVLRIDAEMKQCWHLIDRETERFKTQSAKAEKPKTPDFNVQNYRSYISKAVKAGNLTDKKFVEVQHRVSALIDCGIPMEPETIEKLKKLGINTE